MLRSVTAELDLSVTGSVDLVFSLSVARGTPLREEHLSVTVGGEAVTPIELEGPSGTRLHRLSGISGALAVRYRAAVADRAPEIVPIALELIEYLRPSRYCQSDELFDQARHIFGDLDGHDLIRAVSEFTRSSLTYTPGGSLGTDSAVTTLMTGRGVCRDYAHVVIAMLRAMDVPARYVSCYAPLLDPMDFHAVAEAYVDGRWWVIDATGLAPRRSLVRIASGRDAADCAFLDFHGGSIVLERMLVDAHDARPSTDDHLTGVVLS